MKNSTTILALVTNKLRTRPNASYVELRSLLSEYNIKPGTLLRTYYTAKLHLELEQAKEEAVYLRLVINDLENGIVKVFAASLLLGFALGLLVAYIVTVL